MSVKFYFYSNLDKAFLKAVNDVRRNPEKANDIFAKILYTKKKIDDGTNRNIAIVYRFRSDEDDTITRKAHLLNLREVKSFEENEYETLRETVITKGNIYEGKVDVQPLNTLLKDAHYRNILNIEKFKDCREEKCISELAVCEPDLVKDNSSESGRNPATHMFCRAIYGKEMFAILNQLHDTDEIEEQIVFFSRMANFSTEFYQYKHLANDKVKKVIRRFQGLESYRNEVDDEEIMSYVKEELENFISDYDSFVKNNPDVYMTGNSITKCFYKKYDKLYNNYADNWSQNEIVFWSNDDSEEKDIPKEVKMDDYKTTIYDDNNVGSMLIYELKNNLPFMNFDLWSIVNRVIKAEKTAYGQTYTMYFVKLKNIHTIMQGYIVKYMLMGTNGEYMKNMMKEIVSEFDLSPDRFVFENRNKSLVYYMPNNKNYISYLQNKQVDIGQSFINRGDANEFLSLCKPLIAYAKRGFTNDPWINSYLSDYFVMKVNEVDPIYIRDWNAQIMENILLKCVAKMPIFYVERADNPNPFGEYEQDVDFPLNLFYFTANDRNLIKIGELSEDYENFNKKLDDLLYEVKFRYLVELAPGDNPLPFEKIASLCVIDYKKPSFDYSYVDYPTEKNPTVFTDPKYDISTNVSEWDLLDGMCFSSLLGDEVDILDHLEKDEDNIIFVMLKKEGFQTECLNRKHLYNVLYDVELAKYPCFDRHELTGRPITDGTLNVEGFVDKSKVFFRVDTAFGRYYYGKEDLENIIKSTKKIFYINLDKLYTRGVGGNVLLQQDLQRRRLPVQPNYLVGAHHCQIGSEFQTATIKICRNQKLCINFDGKRKIKGLNNRFVYDSDYSKDVWKEEKRREEEKREQERVERFYNMAASGYGDDVFELLKEKIGEKYNEEIIKKMVELNVRNSKKYFITLFTNVRLGYPLFSEEMEIKLRKDNPDIKIAESTKKISDLWKGLSEQEKNFYKTVNFETTKSEQTAAINFFRNIFASQNIIEQIKLEIESAENLDIFGIEDKDINVKPKEISFNDWNFIRKFRLYADEIRQLYEITRYGLSIDDEEKKQSIIAILKNKIAKSQKDKTRSQKEIFELFESTTGGKLSWYQHIVIRILGTHSQSLLKKETVDLKSWASSEDEIQKAVKKIKKYLDAWEIEGKRIGLFGKGIIPKKIKDEEVISFLQTIGAIELDETSDEDKPLAKLKNPLEQVVGRREERKLGVPQLPLPIPKPMATKPISRPQPAIPAPQNPTIVRKEPGTLKPISRPRTEKKKEESDSDTDDEDLPLSMLRRKPNIVSESESDESDDEMKIPNPDVMWLEQKEREEKNREEDSETDSDDDKPLSYRRNRTDSDTDDESSSSEEEEKKQDRPAVAVRRTGDRKTEKEKDKNFARYGQRKTFREIKNDLGLTNEEFETLQNYPRGKNLQEQIANFYKYKEKSMPTSTQSALSAVQKILKNKAREALQRKKEKKGSKKK